MRTVTRLRIAMIGVVVMLAAAVIPSCAARKGTDALERNAVQNAPIEEKRSQVLPGFRDAVVEAVTILEAEPDRADRRRWPLRSDGSVRLVGTVQKLSPDGNCEVRILAGGEGLWSRELASGDSIRHGFDIAAFDLTADSAVEVLVVAGTRSRRVKVGAAFQVIQEPFITRWRADLPSGFPDFTEQEKETLRKKGQDILQQIRDASAGGQGRIIIPPGDYLFHACWSRASTLKDLADLEIVADGVTFWFEPELVHCLLFENCRDVTVRGLTIDCTIPCWFQARVTSIDREKETIRATLMDGYPPRNAKGELESEGNRAFMFYDANGDFIIHRHTPGVWQLSEEGASVICQPGRHGIPGALKPGDYLVGAIRTGAALRSVGCAGMRYEDVNIWSSPGIAVNEGGGEGGHVYLNVRATRRPRTNRLHAFGADVFHLAGTDRGPTLDRCESAYGSDDNLNIHGSFGRVVQRADNCHYYLQGAYKVGDTIEFRDMKSVELLGIAKVISVDETPDGPSLPINESYAAKGEFLVGLDAVLELPALSLVVLDGKRSASGFVLRNCWLHDNFQRTLINGSPGGIIENTTLQNVGHGICIQFETWGPWMEGPFARDLVIRNCRFLDSPPDGPAISVSMHPPGGGSNSRRFRSRPVTNMTITGNTFTRTDGVCMNIHNVDGLKIHDNNFDMPGSPTDHSEWLYLQDCENVSLVRNLAPLNPRQTREAQESAGSMADLDTPIMTEEAPAAGRRVRQVAPEFEGTEVYHSLYLPEDWAPSGKYPVIVEYTGNRFPPGKGSGEVKDANLGYGLSGGRGFIWVVMPYVEEGRRKNAVQWWGDRQATIAYCKMNLPRICKEFGGDSDNVILCGFSRGAIASSYIGLADDEIAALWKGIFTHDHFDGQREWNYPESDRTSALKRLARLNGRPVLVCGQHASAVRAQFLKDHLELAAFEFLDVPTNQIFNIPEGKVLHPHNDLWMHRESEWRRQARSWLQKVTGPE